MSDLDGKVLLTSAATIVTPDSVLTPGWVLTQGAVIADVGQGEPPRPPDFDLSSQVVVPGFVDTHAHGGGGASFSTEDADEAARVVRAHLLRGTTTMVASLVSAELTVMTRQAALLADLVEEGLLAGIHLEGPWLSPEFKGAHDLDALSAPEEAAVRRLIGAGRGAVRMVTLAPELKNGLDTIRTLTGEGVVVAVGHTAADYDTTRAAVEAGASVATHLFNAMPPLHHRRPGPTLALLEDARVTVEIIVDDVHLHPSVARWAMRSATGGFSLVTDAMAAAGAPDGNYRLGDRRVEVRDEVATLAGTSVIAGSTLTMESAVRKSVRHGLPLVEAIRAATVIPAACLSLPDVGSLRPGNQANLVVLDEDFEVTHIMHRGRWLSHVQPY